MEKQDIYERVTDSIISAIENGAGQYRMPWTVRADKGFSPVSVGSAKPYRGINTVVLWSQAQTKGYDSALWGTYQQWQEIGGQVRKGEHGSPVVYWGTFESKSDNDESTSRHMFAKGYTVFNLLQVDGVKLSAKFGQPKQSTAERIGFAEHFFAAAGVQPRDGGNRAYYRPDVDAVYMPGFDQFAEPVAYYSVLAHESTHWTSHASRCDRQLGKRFGDDAYAAEELIAELGSAFTMARLELELTPRVDHAQYLASWLRVLKADKRAIFTAASQAQKAADYLARTSETLKAVA